MAYPVKWFSGNMEGAPSLSTVGWPSADLSYGNSSANNYQDNYVQGELAAILKACLLTGFGIKSITSATYDSGTSTATFTTATTHDYAKHSIIEVSGADQPEYNGEHRIIATTASTFTVTLDSAPGATPATGTIESKVAPVGGWSAPYESGNGDILFRRSASDASPFDLFVRNAYNYQDGDVGLISGSTDLGLPFAISEVVENWVDESTYDLVDKYVTPCQRFASNDNFGAQEPDSSTWKVFSDGYGFWLVLPWDRNGYNSAFFFGDIVSARPGDRGAFLFIKPINITSSYSSNNYRGSDFFVGNYGSVTGNTQYSTLATNYANLPGKVRATALLPYKSENHYGSAVAYPNPANGAFFISKEPIPVVETVAEQTSETAGVHALRGFLPGLLPTPHGASSQDGKVFVGAPNFGDTPIYLFRAIDPIAYTVEITFGIRLDQWRDIAL